MLSKVDCTRITPNLWGERWSKLCHNAMRNGISAATGLSSRGVDEDKRIRNFTILVGAEAIRVGRALGFDLVRIGKLMPDVILKGAEGDAEAMAIINESFVPKGGKSDKSPLRRASMAQDIAKGRRTEIDAINGFIVEKGKEVGVATPLNSFLLARVKEIERGVISPAPSVIPEDLSTILNA